MSNIIENAIEYIKTFFASEYSGHDFDHSIRVYKLAKTIAIKENANVTLVSLAALLHDVDDVKISPNTHEDKLNAVSFLKNEDVSESDIDSICTIISEVSFNGADTLTPSTLEGKCVQDADRLDAIGAIGIARAFAFGGNHNREIHNPDIKPVLNMSKEEYRNHKSTTINHFYEKLFLLKDMINTQTAREIADHRDKFMRSFVDEFLCEWDGTDFND
ncbi:MAG: HD domain-containing protein [Clostridia bacterium]|nr:HD domain-containing protein [Clostridia bacterium]